jgi:GrpB-like predicted nucleotidyltransferase (UPF0157 family)
MTESPPQREAPILLAPYDPSWPSVFELERNALERTLEPWLSGPIEHIGSTAVPGLLAKPVIDIMAAVDTLDMSRPAIAVLVGLGWAYFPYRAEVMHWFCKPSPAFRTHHLHLVPFGSPLWTERLAFRNYLRRDPLVAAEYAQLKRELAERYAFDREAYTDAKGPFVRRVLDRALATEPRLPNPSMHRTREELA